MSTQTIDRTKAIHADEVLAWVLQEQPVASEIGEFTLVTDAFSDPELLANYTTQYNYSLANAEGRDVPDAALVAD